MHLDFYLLFFIKSISSENKQIFQVLKDLRVKGVLLLYCSSRGHCFPIKHVVFPFQTQVVRFWRENNFSKVTEIMHAKILGINNKEDAI